MYVRVFLHNVIVFVQCAYNLTSGSAFNSCKTLRGYVYVISFFFVFFSYFVVFI